MTDRGASTFAVGIALLVALAGMVVLLPGDATATPAYGSAAGDGQLTRYDGTPGGSASASSAPDAQYELYRALSTCVPTSPEKMGRSRSERQSGESRDADTRLHRWRCPICDATKLSFGTPNGDPDEEAANNLRSHLRNSDGNGHGPPGTLPPSVTPELIRESVAVSELAE